MHSSRWRMKAADGMLSEIILPPLGSRGSTTVDDMAVRGTCNVTPSKDHVLDKLRSVLGMAFL
jgi:hypothetical protein